MNDDFMLWTGCKKKKIFQILSLFTPLFMSTPATLQTELRRRAEWEKPKTRLVADYYRIRRKLAYPLPLRQLITPAMEIPDIPEYPWAIWVLWDLEERMNTLQWAGYQDGDDEARGLYLEDLEALAGWPRYSARSKPDLSAGHAARLLHQAYHQVPHLGTVQEKIESAFERIIEDLLPEARKMYGSYSKPEEILSQPSPHEILHNLPWIGTTSLGLATRALNHPARDEVDTLLAALLGAFLEHRKTGLTEGVAYDGYILDFVLPWLVGLPEEQQRTFLEHPRMQDMGRQSLHLAVPGNLANVAEIGDVEPRHMPFHLSAQAKLLEQQENPEILWLLRNCPAEWLRADALSSLLELEGFRDSEPTPNGPVDLPYALVMRSGWESQDLAVAMSANQSPMGHLPPDVGTLVIGTRGRWMIDDPGYQQYMQKAERLFSRGLHAHNAPILNETAIEVRPKQRSIQSGTNNENLPWMQVEFSEVYLDSLAVKSVRRMVWLVDNLAVVVADEIIGEGLKTVDYNWHGHSDLAWWEEEGNICLLAPEATLWIQNPQGPHALDAVIRLPGSRGQLTLQSRRQDDLPVIWWVFSLGENPCPLHLGQNRRTLEILGHSLSINPDTDE